MRQITRESVNAFNNLRGFNKANMAVEVKGTTKGVPTWAVLKLHGNTIAEINKTEDKTVLRITNAGWQSNTTKERLNALDGVSIYQKKGIWYLNGVEWDGKWIEI